MTLIDELTDRLAAGESIQAAEALALFEAPDLIAVGSLGDGARRRRHGTRTTFVRVFEVHVDAAPAVLPPGTSAGEFRIVGRPQSLASALAAVRAVAALAAGAPVTGFTLHDLHALAAAEARPFDEIVAGLRDAGLDAIAEVAVDLCADGAAAIETARGAGLRVMRLTVRSLAPGTRVTMLERARDLQTLLGGFHAFAPLPRIVPVEAPTTGYEDVKLVAVARLVVANIPSIQVDWPLYGPKLAQVALIVGADDVDGVEAVESGTLGTRRSALEEIRRNIRAAGLEPIERDGRFASLAR